MNIYVTVTEDGTAKKTRFSCFCGTDDFCVAADRVATCRGCAARYDISEGNPVLVKVASGVMKIAVPLGSWDVVTGEWFPNSQLILPAREQHELNVMNGFSCEHYKRKTACSICKDRTSSEEALLKKGLQDLEQLVNENHRGVQVVTGYEPLAAVLKEALDQAQYGKGKKCHAKNGRPFLEQPIMVGGRECGPGGLAFQARKKILEALNCEDDDRAIEDLLGAINYTAAMVLLRREG